MTLILSYVSRDFAVQVCDRQLTDGRTGQVINDTTTKLTLFDGSALVGFTGLGTLAGEPTHRWITVALRKAANAATPARGIFECFGQDLDMALAATSLPPALRARERALKRIAVMAVGFGRAYEGSPWIPAFACVSNFHRRAGGWLPEAEATCTTNVGTLPANRSYMWFAIGADLTVPETRAMYRGLNRCAKHRTGPGPIVRLFCELIPKVSARNAVVGCSLLVGSIPSTQLGAPYSLTIFGRPDFRERTFLYIPEDSNDQRFFGPNIADRHTALCDVLVCPEEQFDPRRWPTR